MFYDRFRLAIRSLKQHKARSFLSLLGIAVGIAAIVSLISVGSGMEQMVVGELADFADSISVMPGAMGPMGFVPLGAFTERDIEDIRRIEGVREVDPGVWGFTTVEHRGERIPIGIIGGDPHAMERDFEGIAELREGRWLREDDHGAALIGYLVATEFFEHEVSLNDRIVIRETNFVVVGILDRVGGMMGMNIDPSVYLTMKCAQQALGLGPDEISLMSVRVYDVAKAEEIATKIRETIDANHGLGGFTFTSTVVEFIEGIKMVSVIIQAFLVGIASIALLVGGIGIVNSMLMSVMERTREIGIMKAIGATNGNILSQFLLEAVVITLLGGILGGIVGAGIATLVSLGITHYVGVAMPVGVTVPVLAGGVLIAIVVGVLSGLYPARRAMKMNPVEAMRRE